jgi:catechol 2,3-dioxygenase-like lactoylglutathione lyase family enzyme
MAHLKPRLLSHGTVECHDLGAARRFYTELLGMEVVQTSAISLMLRLNTNTTKACVETKGETSAGHYSHFGFDFETREEVDAAHEIVLAQKDNYGVKKVTRPLAQHGTYAFYVVDADDNWWEFLTNPEGGYSYVFELGDNDGSWRDQDQGRDRIGNWETARGGE